jgi:hypothetical protein
MIASEFGWTSVGGTGVEAAAAARAIRIISNLPRV